MVEFARKVMKRSERRWVREFVVTVEVLEGL